MEKALEFRYQVILGYIQKKYSRKEAARLLQISERQITRLKLQIQTDGIYTFLEKTHASNIRIEEHVRRQVIELKQTDLYKDLNIKQFLDVLETKYQIQISYPTLYGILREANILSPVRKKEELLKNPGLKERKKSFGERLRLFLLSFAEQEKSRYLYLAVDDATGKITGYYESERKVVYGYFSVLAQTFKNYGKPTEVTAEGLCELLINQLNELEVSTKILVDERYTYLKALLTKYFESQIFEHKRDWNLMIKAYNKENGLRAYGVPRFSILPAGTIPEHYFCLKQVWKMNQSGRLSINQQIYQVMRKGYSLPPKDSIVKLFIHTPYCVHMYYKSNYYEVMLIENTEKSKIS